MEQIVTPASPLSPPRVWYRLPFADRRARAYLISFRIAEEATWDHRFHDLEGRELAEGELELSAADRRFIQACCDRAVGSARVELSLPVLTGGAVAHAVQLEASPA